MIDLEPQSSPFTKRKDGQHNDYRAASAQDEPLQKCALNRDKGKQNWRVFWITDQLSEDTVTDESISCHDLPNPCNRVFTCIATEVTMPMVPNNAYKRIHTAHVVRIVIPTVGVNKATYEEQRRMFRRVSRRQTIRLSVPELH